MKTNVPQIVSAFSEVAGTTYGPGYGHPPESHAFFDSVLRVALSRVGASPLRVLELGCGNGYWLRSVAQTASRTGLVTDLHGVDATPALIRQAQESPRDLLPPPTLSVGDFLATGGVTGRYHLGYAYDVVQQIDPLDHPLVFSSVRSLLEPGGVFIVFDRDPWSRYGVSTGIRKFLTRRLGLRLVPDFYLLARYPRFRRLARLARRAGFEVVADLRGASRRALVLKTL